MASWQDLYIQKGVYISKPFDVSSGYEYYMQDLKYQFDKNDGVVDIFLRISYDGTNFGEWVKINDSAVDILFRDDFYYMEFCKFQYKVEMINNGVVSPVFNNFTFNLYGSFLFDNMGDIICRPEMWIKKINNSGNIVIKNETNGQQLVFNNLNKDETVYIDCENEDIATDLPNKYRYSDHNNVFMEFEVGENIITGEGEFELVIRHEFKTLQG